MKKGQRVKPLDSKVIKQKIKEYPSALIPIKELPDMFDRSYLRCRMMRKELDIQSVLDGLAHAIKKKDALRMLDAWPSMGGSKSAI